VNGVESGCLLWGFSFLAAGVTKCVIVGGAGKETFV
jgi:hypothetical protein